MFSEFLVKINRSNRKVHENIYLKMKIIKYKAHTSKFSLTSCIIFNFVSSAVNGKTNHQVIEIVKNVLKITGFNKRSNQILSVWLSWSNRRHITSSLQPVTHIHTPRHTCAFIDHTHTHTHIYASLGLQPVMLITLLLHKAEKGEIRIRVNVTIYVNRDGVTLK